MIEGGRVVHRTQNFGIGKVLAIIQDRDEGIEVVRVEWPYDVGIREHISHRVMGYSDRESRW